MNTELSERQADVLDAIVERFIVAASPVASSAITGDLTEKVSAATVRNVMAELEARGLVYQPHTSAGRVPTARGYGRYVRNLLRSGRLRSVDEEAIRRRLSGAQLEMSALLRRACRLLSELSNHVGVLLVPPPGDTVIRDVDFVSLGQGRILTIFVTGGGAIHNRTLELDDPPSDRELEAAGNEFAERFRGCTLRDAGDLLRSGPRPAAEDDPVGRLAGILGSMALEEGIDRAEVLVAGASHLLGDPELTDSGALPGLFAAVEDRRQIGAVLTRCASETPQVMIGEERLPRVLGSCTVIAAGYTSADRTLGALGILGPTRMEYARTIPTVGAMARATSEMLTELSA